VEFLVISLFHETKIPTADMKIHVSSNFSTIFWKKIKSSSSMGIGRFYISKYRGKLQEMEVLYTHSSKMPAHPHDTKKNMKK
jgi:hypothetical protein